MNKANENKIPQYDVYEMKGEELAITLIIAMSVCFLIGLLFYENVILSAIFSLVGILYVPIRKREQLRKRKEVLNLQFKDLLYFLSVSLSAGKSMETSIFDTQKAISGIYPDQNSDIIRELEIMNGRIMMNETVEKVFEDFAARSGIGDIKSFADVIMISKRAGANLVEVVKNTSSTISEKVEIHQEIENLIAGKKFEQRVMSAMPFAMVFFLKNSGSDYLKPLMTTAYGHVIMTIALAMILVGLFLGQKIMRIEV